MRCETTTCMMSPAAMYSFSARDRRLERISPNSLRASVRSPAVW
jgi:hypothetical protein